MLDKQSPIPIYIQIEEQLKQQIQQGDFSVGTSIPSERELSERFAVSRMTVRQSITNLVNDGLLYREKGRGTFVASPKVEQPLNGLTSFTEDMESRGMVPSSKLIGFEILDPETDVAHELQLDDGDQVYFVERIRFADDKPMAIERTFLPVKRFPNLTEESFQGSLYAVIENKQQLKISHAPQRMEAGLVKMIERISFLEGDLPFEVVRSTYRADRYKFTTEIQR